MNKNARTASLLARISGVLYLLGAVLAIIICSVTPVSITINGNHTSAYLWEFKDYPGPLMLVLCFILFLAMLGIFALILSIRVKRKATNRQGIVMLIMGFFTIPFMVGVLFIIAAVQTFLAKKEEENQLNNANKVD